MKVLVKFADGLTMYMAEGAEWIKDVSAFITENPATAKDTEVHFYGRTVRGVPVYEEKRPKAA